MNNVPPRPLPMRLLAFLWGLIRLAVFFLGVILLIAVILGYVAFRRLEFAHSKPLPARFTLVLNLTRQPADIPPPEQWLKFGEAVHPTLAETIMAIDHAAHDRRVRGIDIRLGGGCCNLTGAEEIHNAIARFRAATGRPVTARAMSFDGSSGLGAYVIASAASRIELSQAGDFGVTGLALATPFAGAALQTIGVDAQFEHIGAYKTYPQLFTRSSPSKANVKMLNSLADSLYASALAPIAARLRQSPDQVKALLDQAPFTAQAAQAKGLVDAVLPLTARVDDFPGPQVPLGRYAADTGGHPAKAPKVALIIGQGDIGSPSDEGSASGIEPRRLARELRAAIDDRSVKAILLRLDTPGGTVTGSAMIGAEVAAAAAAHKPLIVSMGGMDASGGYWISSHGAKLIADPATLTGSIGVLGGKLSFDGLLRKIGISVTTITRGANAGLDSPVKPWNQAQLANLMTMLNADYQDFVNWVASGRHMTPAQVNAIGQGRVWTGAQAKQNGLVDQLGGYHAALDAVRAALRLPVHAPLDVVNGNEKPTLHELLTTLMARSNPLGMAALPPGLRDIMALARPHMLEMPPIMIH
ncbi:MAG TPA: signal peptide peptidase SppA [Acetobacteraceae bacterium]|nr:signal peptide peptidase SppA [Acetobacteraceae bacterium]